MRFYYKHKTNSSLLNLKTPLSNDDYILITSEEFYTLNAQQRAQQPIRDEAKATAARRINKLKKLLADTDYQAIKYAEGMISEEEYAPIKAQRQAWRDEINQLEATL